MARQCKVCESPYKVEIETQIDNGISARIVSSWLKQNHSVTIGYNSIQRHIKLHTDILKNGDINSNASIVSNTNEDQRTPAEIKRDNAELDKYERWKLLDRKYEHDKASAAEMAAGHLAEDETTRKQKEMGEQAVRAIERVGEHNRINEEAARVLAEMQQKIAGELVAEKEKNHDKENK